MPTKRKAETGPLLYFGLLRCVAQSIATLEGGCWLLACARVLGGIYRHRLQLESRWPRIKAFQHSTIEMSIGTQTQIYPACPLRRLSHQNSSQSPQDWEEVGQEDVDFIMNIMDNIVELTETRLTTTSKPSVMTKRPEFPVPGGWHLAVQRSQSWAAPLLSHQVGTCGQCST